MTRHEARQFALQALYQIEVGKTEAFSAIKHVLEDASLSDSDLAFIRSLVEGTQNHLVHIDELLAKYIENWTMDRIAKVDLTVMRLATYELLYVHDIDIPTILDEAIELAKEFSTEASGKFVNGVLVRLLPTVQIARGNNTDGTGLEPRG